MPNIIKWLFRRQSRAISEDLDKRLTGPLPTNVHYLRLVDPPTVARDDFADKLDRVVERMEGGHDQQD